MPQFNIGEISDYESMKEYMRIQIPNQDQGDHTPWASFVLPAKSVHENQYGKGLWAKIPADGTTTVTKPVAVGDQDGKRIINNFS